jgi:hypothetical protein
MHRNLSRPERWEIATRGAESALNKIYSLRDELIQKRDELQEQWENQCSTLHGAVVDLMCLQQEYENMMEAHPNLDESRFERKRHRVLNVDFESMRKSIPDLQKLTAMLEQFNPIDNNDFNELNRVEPGNLPKGYGRD